MLGCSVPEAALVKPGSFLLFGAFQIIPGLVFQEQVNAYATLS
jgi:hypothetical protein